jgi:4'-phosphopantetheinyl transferase EntD
MVIDTILPDRVFAEEGGPDDDRGFRLFPEEEALLGRAVAKRRKEFVGGRACAHRALERLGRPPSPILSGTRGEPEWPAGVVGSITHCEGYRASAVANASEFVTVGIDAEPNRALPAGVLRDVAGPEERAELDELRRAQPDVNWDRLLFSAKEAVYKAWFPLARRWLGFEDALVTLDPHRNSFDARLLVPGPHIAGSGELTGFLGRWRVGNGVLLSAIALPCA